MSFEVIVDEFTDNKEEQCNLCKGKFICETFCCKIKLCQFCFRRKKDDNEIIECEFCIERENLIYKGENAWRRKNGFIFCSKHNSNKLILCSECGFNYCEKHFLDNKNFEEKDSCKCGHGWIFLELPK